MSRYPLTWFGCLVLCLAGPVGCRKTEGGETPTARGSAPRPPDVPQVNLTEGPPSRESRFTRDALWRRAARGSEVDLMRLAHREGPLGLIEGFNEGRSVALTALAALPYADDAELALPRLCAPDSVVVRQPTQSVLHAIQGIASQPPEPREPVAPGARQSCFKALSQLLKTHKLAPPLFDLASSARQLLEQHRDAAHL